MTRSYSKTLVQAVAVTAELCGTTLSADAARVMVDDLSGYPEPAVLEALTRCRREVKGRLTIAEIVSRIDDGRPGAEEAWGMIAHDERDSCMMTDEMAEALGVARQLLEAGDMVAARLAFRETYLRLVQGARASRTPVRWFVSLGWDEAGQSRVVREAVRQGRLTLGHACSMFPRQARDLEMEFGDYQARIAYAAEEIGAREEVNALIAGITKKVTKG